MKRKNSKIVKEAYLRAGLILECLGGLSNDLYEDYWFKRAESREMHKLVLRIALRELQQNITTLRLVLEEKVRRSATRTAAAAIFTMSENLCESLTKKFLLTLDGGSTVHLACGILEGVSDEFSTLFFGLEKQSRLKLLYDPKFLCNVLTSSQLGSFVPEFLTLVKQLRKTPAGYIFYFRARTILTLYRHLRFCYGEIYEELANTIANAFIKAIKQEKHWIRRGCLRGLYSQFHSHSESVFPVLPESVIPTKIESMKCISVNRRPPQWQQRFATTVIL